MTDDNVETKRNILQRINKHIGGGFGWFGIIVGLCFIAGGITALVLNPGTAAVTAGTTTLAAAGTTTAIGLSALTAGAALGMGIVGLIVGAAIIAAIIIYPIIKEKLEQKRTAARNIELKKEAKDNVPCDLESHKIAQQKEMTGMEKHLLNEQQRQALLSHQPRSSGDEESDFTADTAHSPVKTRSL